MFRGSVFGRGAQFFSGVEILLGASIAAIFCIRVRPRVMVRIRVRDKD